MNPADVIDADFNPEDPKSEPEPEPKPEPEPEDPEPEAA